MVLVAIADLSLSPTLGLALAGAVVGLLVARLWQRPPAFARDVMLISASIGGLAMLAGDAIDRAIADPAAAHHAGHMHHAHGSSSIDLSMLGTWMCIVMLVACIPACALLCRTDCDRSVWQQTLTHGLCTVGMLAGMLIAGSAASRAGVTSLPAHHLAMLAGMVMGSGAVAKLAWLVRQQLTPTKTPSEAT